MLDKLTSNQRDDLKESDFAVPGKRALPIHDKTHIKMAWDMVDRTKGLSAEEKKTARERILTAAKKADVDTEDWAKKPMTDSFMAQVDVVLDSSVPEQKEQLPPGVLMRVKIRGTKADIVNSHNRLYPRNVMADAVVQAEEKYVKTGTMIAESPHPRSLRGTNGEVVFDTKLENTVARHISIAMDSEGWAVLESDILDTAKGRDLATLIRAGVPVGVSMRGLNKTVRKVINDSAVAVATEMDIQTFDFVMNPATDGCGVTGVVMADSQLEAILDGLQFNDPICPLDGNLLKPYDPDLDNDVDFWECPKCKSRYDVYNGVQVTTSSNQNLYRRWDSPNYGTAQAQINSQAAAKTGDPTLDSQIPNSKEANKMPELTPEQIQEMIANATKPFQTMLDAQATAEQEKVNRQAAQAFLDSKFDEIKPKYSETVLSAIKKAVGEPKSKEAAEIVLDSVLDMASQFSANEFLQSLGFTPQAGSTQGQTRWDVGNEPKPWQPLVDSMMQAFDRIDAEKGFIPDPELRKQNKELVDKIVNKFESKDIGYQRMTDSMNQVQALLDSGASITTAQLLNQPTIQTVILLQKFQDLEATQFMMSDVFEGSEWRIPSETFVGAATVDPATFLYDIVVSENNAIPEAQIDVIWASFTPKPRRNAISLTTDVIAAMGTGPLKYNAPARAIYHIGKQAARHIDSYAYWDMAVTADEYYPLVVSNESVSNVAAVSNGTNVAYKGQLTLGGKANTTIQVNGQNVTLAPQGYTPIVRPRNKQVITANGSVQQQTTNPITVKVGSTTLVQGGLDNNGNIVGTGAQFAINFETGDIYFVSGLGINPGTVNPVASYSASTNYDLWHTTTGSGYSKVEDWYNTLIQQLSVSAALMGSSPRFNAPNLALFSLNTANYVRNASIFYALNNPPATSLTPTRNYFGKRDDVDLFKLNAPWVLGDGRILLTQKNATRYGIQTPYKIEGPITKQDPTSGNLLPVKAWYGEEFSAIVTPQVIDSNSNVVNPVSRTIRIVP